MKTLPAPSDCCTVSTTRTIRHDNDDIVAKSQRNGIQEGLAVASIARDVVVEMTPPRDDNAR